MSNVINFQVERALRQTGLHRSLIEDIVEDGFNPLDPIEVEQYFDWFSVSATIEMAVSYTHLTLPTILLV